MMRALLNVRSGALCAALLLVAGFTARPAQAQLPFTGVMVSDTSLTLDSNRPCTDGPRSGYVAFKVTNNGAARTGMYIELTGFAQGIALSTNQNPRLYAGNWAAGATRTFYWFIEYSCIFGSTANLVARVTEGSTLNSAEITRTVTTRSMLSSNGGGKLIAGGLGPGAVVGQTIYVDVEYEFGGVNAGDTYSLQASGTIAHNAQCFQLVKTEILSSPASQITAVPSGTQDVMFFTAAVSQSGSGYRTTMRYWFKYLCMGQQSYLQPYTNQLSGTQLKYSGNWASFVGPTLPTAANSFTVAKRVSPTALPTGGTATYTIVVRNTSPTLTAAVDSLVDVLPSGVSYTGLHASSTVTVANSSSTPINGAINTIKFLGPWDVLPGDSLRLVYTANIPNTPGSYTNNASAHTGISIIGTGSATLLVGQADVRVVKSGPTNAFTADSIKYVITTTNLGPQAALNVIVTDTLPAGVTLKRATRTPTQSGNVLTWPAIASLANAAIVRDTVVIHTPLVLSTLTNRAASTSNTYDPTPANNNGSLAAGRVVTNVAAATTDLSIAKAVNGSLTVGSDGSYTITVFNNGAASAGIVTVVDTLPAGLTFVSGAGTNWAVSAVGQVVTATYSGPAIAQASTAAFTLTVSVSAPATPSVTNRAWVSGGGDTNATNNGSGDVTTAITGVRDLSITKTAAGAFAQGISSSYTITVTNVGTQTTSGTITVLDTLPTGITYVSGSGTGWAVNHALGVVTATYAGTLAAGVSANFTINITPGAAAVPSVTNKAVVSGGSQVYFANDTARVTTAVTASYNLGITKTSSALTQYAAGTYTITVTNAGPAASNGTITVIDTVPPSISSVSGSGTGWTVDVFGQVVTATYTGSLASGTSASFTLNVMLGASPASMPNRAHLYNTNDGNTSNNTGTVTSTVTQMPDVQLVKSSSTPFVIGSNTATYSFTVVNNGYASTAGTVTVTDTLPVGIAYVAKVGSSNWTVSYNGATRVVTATYAIAIAASTAAQTLSITVSVGIGTTTPLLNRGWVSGGGENNTANNYYEVTTAVSGADLRIVKTSGSLFTPSTNGTYTFTVTNIGSTATSGTTTVTDTLPAGLTATAGVTAVNGWTLTITLLGSGRYRVVATNATALAAAASSNFTVTVAVTASAMPSVSNKVWLANTSQYNPANDTSRLVTAVASPDVTILKELNSTFNGGYVASYKITITNSGSYTTAGNIVVTDVLPAGLTYDAAGTSGSGWSFGNTGQTVTATYAAALAASASTFFIVSVNVAESAAGEVFNTATVTGGNDQVPGNNSSGPIPTPVLLGQPTITLMKSVTPAGEALPGAVLTYTITALNTGTAGAKTLVLQDSIPVALQYFVGSAGITLPSGVTATTAFFGAGSWAYAPASEGCGAPVGYDACVSRVRWTIPNLPISLQVTASFSGQVR